MPAKKSALLFITSLLKACVCVITVYDKTHIRVMWANNINDNNDNNNITVKQHNEGKREKIKEEI